MLYSRSLLVIYFIHSSVYMIIFKHFWIVVDFRQLNCRKQNFGWGDYCSNITFFSKSFLISTIENSLCSSKLFWRFLTVLTLYPGVPSLIFDWQLLQELIPTSFYILHHPLDLAHSVAQTYAGEHKKERRRSGKPAAKDHFLICLGLHISVI